MKCKQSYFLSFSIWIVDLSETIWTNVKLLDGSVLKNQIRTDFRFFTHPQLMSVLYGIVGFNVPLVTLQVISEMILRVRWPNQQCHSTEGWWLVNHVTGQSHQAQLTKR